MVTNNPEVFRPLTKTHNHNPVGGSAVVASHYSLPPGCQLNSSLLLQIQQEALSAASPSLRTAFFLSFPLSPTSVISFQADWARKPLHPTSTGYNHVPAILDLTFKAFRLPFKCLLTPLFPRHCKLH